MSNSTTRAVRALGREASLPKHSAVDTRHDHCTAHGRATPRDSASKRRGSNQMQAQTGASMSYQQGFTSGPMT